MGLLACAIEAQLIHVTDTDLVTLPWCFNLKMAPRTKVVQQQIVLIVLLLSISSSFFFLRIMFLNVVKQLIDKSWCC